MSILRQVPASLIYLQVGFAHVTPNVLKYLFLWKTFRFLKASYGSYLFALSSFDSTSHKHFLTFHCVTCIIAHTTYFFNLQEI